MKPVIEMTSAERKIHYETLYSSCETEKIRLENIERDLKNLLKTISLRIDGLGEVISHAKNDLDDVKYNECFEITVAERNLIESFSNIIKTKKCYVVRNMDSRIYLYDNLPVKMGDSWLGKTKGNSYLLPEKSFPFIRWWDDTPWLAEDILNLKIKEEK